MEFFRNLKVDVNTISSESFNDDARQARNYHSTQYVCVIT
jgi:hypothetical protein